jgi:hypothetical protein
MKRNFSVVLALSALILTGGCKKAITSNSVDLAGGAKASFALNTQWQQPTLNGRVIRYDINDGHGSDCLFTYDIGTGMVSLTQVSSTGSTNIVNNEGLLVQNNSPFDIRAYNTDVTDNYNEVGGVHFIPYDATGSGHEDHLLMYIPGRGIVYLWTYAGNGVWQQTWNSSTGIGGYNLTGFYDKIIAYDWQGTGHKKDLICYRPGSGIFWVLVNTGTASAPVWTPRVQSNGGVGGFDLKGTMDQLVAFEGPISGYMGLLAYRPSYGYVWGMSHTANSVNWSASDISSRQGLYQSTVPFPAANIAPPYFTCADLQDRILIMNGLNFPAAAGSDDLWFPYRPGGTGGGLAASYLYTVQYDNLPPEDGGNGGGDLVARNLFPNQGANYQLTHDPYNGTSYGTGIGDHIIAFSPTDQGNTDLLFYSNGGGNASQLYTWNAGTSSYTQVY